MYSSIRGEPGAIASWNGEDLHVFVVASLALVLAVPSRSWRDRIRLLVFTAAVILFVCLALTIVQIKTVAETYSSSYLGLTLHSPGEKAFLDHANRGLIMVGMLLLPTFLFLTAYISSWSDRPAEAGGNPDGSPDTAPPWSKRARLFAIGSLVAVFLSGLALAVFPDRSGKPLPLESLRHFASLNPGSSRAHFLLGVRCESEGRLAEARGAYEVLLQLDPGDIVARYNLGNVLFKLGEYSGAGAAYQGVLHLDPAHLSARNNLGNVLFKQGRYEEARGAYEAVLSIDGSKVSAQRNLGEALLQLGRPCEALPHLDRSASLDPGIAGDSAFSKLVAQLREECK